jgi:hypothetical protein
VAHIPEYWPWIIAAISALLLILAYNALVRKAQAYTARVRHELEGYVKAPTPAAPAITPLSIPPRNPSDSATLSDEKQKRWTLINKHPMNYYEQVDLLVTQLSEARIAAKFLETYFLITGSQYTYLRILNEQTGTGALTRTNSEAFLQAMVASNTAVATANYDFNRWLHFLVTRGLVTVGVDNVIITNMGQDFLVWVTRQQLPNRTYEAA